MEEGRLRPEMLAAADGQEVRARALTDEGAEDELEATRTEAWDADFGLSDGQLEELWLRFCDGNEEVGRERALTEDIETRERHDSEYGLSDRQLAELAARCAEDEGNHPGEEGGEKATPSQTAATDSNPGTLREPATATAAAREPVPPPLPAPQRPHHLEAEATPEAAAGRGPAAPAAAVAVVVDPLRHFAGKKAAQAPTSKARGPASKPAAKPKTAEQFLAEQLPTVDPARAARLAAGPPRKPRVVLVSSRELDGVTWYLFRVDDDGGQRLYMKRYSDFVRLDAALRAHPPAGRSRVLPELPEKGSLGLRKKLDIMDFNAKRRDGLGNYMARLLADIQTFVEEPALMGFFDRDAPGRILSGFGG